MAITRNTIDLAPAQSAAVNKKTDPYDKTRRSIRLGEAEQTFEKTGDYDAFKSESGKVAQKVLGGSAEQYSVKNRQWNVGDADYSNRVQKAQEDYKANPNEETAKALKDVVGTGFQRYDAESSKGINISSALRNIDISEFDRKIADIQADWKNDPEKFKDAYKQALQEQIDFYGKGSVKAVSLENAMRAADEESLLYGVRNAELEYEKDPVGAYEKLMDAQSKLIEFYGSSSDGYYASQALSRLGDVEQERLDTQASDDFELGKIGYNGYSSYLKATMSKYPEGSTNYMKYYKASGQLDFNKQMDDIIRLQYSEAPGEVLKSLKAAQAGYEAGSSAYQTVQDSIDKFTTTIKQNAYNEMIKKEVKKRQEEIAGLNAKLYTLQMDLENGDIDEDDFKKKYKNYSAKVAYLSDSNTLPQFEIYKTYGADV